MNTRIIDGQRIYFPDHLEMDNIFISRSFKGFGLGERSLDLIKKRDYHISKDYEDIVLGLGFVTKFCLIYTFVKIKDNYHRVSLENRTCECCNSKLMIANPIVLANYFGVKNDFEVMRKARDIDQVKCPNCLEVIIKNAIWAIKQ